MALDLLIFGPPGAGKGTQATAVSERAGVPHIATGDMFRAHIKAGTPLGLEAKGYSSRGELVPDGVTIQMLGERIAEPDTEPGFLLDGFPRTLPQAQALDDLLAERNRSITALLSLEVPDDEIVRRITGRLVGKESGRIYHVTDAPPKVSGIDDVDGTPLIRRPDDDESVVRERLRVFHDETLPVLQRARDEGMRVVTINGARHSDVVAAELATIIDGLPPVIIRKSRRELERMAAAGSVVARALEMLRREAVAGVTTGDLDRLAEEFIRAQGGVPTFKGYHGFTGSICSSPNNMIVHGIPGPYELKDGDVISIDVGVTLKGWVADSAITVAVGEVPADAIRLLETCRLSLFDAIEACTPGAHLSDVGHAVQTRVESEGFGVVRALVGHGVGRRMHEDPQVPNYGPAGRGPVLAAGMVLAIEPMITAGDHAIQPDADDGWSIYTADGSLASHFEHTVAVTDAGPLVLTRHEGWSPVDDVVVAAA